MNQTLTTLASGVAYGDLQFRGRLRIIATVALFSRDGVAIVDPGPTSTLPVLKQLLQQAGAAVSDITALLLTHIHLDHAGASGTLLRENPRIRVFVHETGAPHMADPSKLLASAGRLYGDAMATLWGEVAPVQPSAIVALRGGERLAMGERQWDVAYTPGHASHHVSYFSSDLGLALVGDTAGVQVLPGGFILPPTPPPDIDVPVWLNSLAAIERWRPQTLLLTHFGPANDVPTHLAEFREHLELFARIAEESLEQGADDSSREALFVERVRDCLSRRMSDADLKAYETAGRFDLNWRGLARFLTRRRG